MASEQEKKEVSDWLDTRFLSNLYLDHCISQGYTMQKIASMSDEQLNSFLQEFSQRPGDRLKGRLLLEKVVDHPIVWKPQTPTPNGSDSDSEPELADGGDEKVVDTDEEGDEGDSGREISDTPDEGDIDDSSDSDIPPPVPTTMIVEDTDSDEDAPPIPSSAPALPPTPPPIDLSALMKGTVMTKYKKSTPSSRLLWLADDCKRLLWGDPTAKTVTGFREVTDITHVSWGCKGAKHMKHAFTLGMKDNKPLFFEAEAVEIAERWVNGLTQLID